MSAKKTASAGAMPDLEGMRAANLLEQEQAALDSIEAARAEANEEQEWAVHVTRIEGPDKKRDGREARLFNCTLEDLAAVPDQLKQDYGEGVYRVRVALNRKNFRQWDIQIELSPAERLAFRSRATVPTLAQQPSSPMTAPPADAGNMYVLAEAMRQQTEMMGRMMERFATPPAQQNPIDSFQAVAAAFKSFQDLQPKPETNNPVEVFEKALELAEKIADARGGGDEGGGLGSIIAGFLQSDTAKTLVERLTMPPQLGGAPMQQPQHRALQTPPPVQQPQPAPANAPQPQAPIAMDQVHQAVAYLVGQAQLGTQPDLFADSALAMMPLGLVEELEQTDDAMGLLISRFPAIADHRPWFEALLSSMFMDVEEEGAAPNAANTQPAKPAAAAAG